MSRHNRFEIITGADGDKAAGFPGKQISNGTGILPQQGDTSQNKCPGVYLLPLETGNLVLTVNKAAQGIAINGSIINVWC